MRALFLAAALMAASGAHAQTPAQSPATAPQSLPVGTIAVTKRPVTPGQDFVGRIEAVDRVDIVSRVTGMLQDVLFKEGATVKPGDKLYTIEKDLFDAAVQQAQGSLERAQATLKLATLQRERAEELLTRNAGSAASRDQAVAQEGDAKGAVMSAEAALKTAKTNLAYTDIASPITGKIGKTNVTKGNTVSPQTGPLTEIVSQDPMHVVFPITQRDALTLSERMKANGGSGKISIKFSNGSTYAQTGVIDFIGVSVDRNTDTVQVRGTIANPNETLIHGQLVRVALQAAQPVEKVVIPQVALLADQQGVYCFVVDQGKAAIRRLKVGQETGAGGIIIEEGLNAGDQLIVQGLQMLRAGAAVTAHPIQLPSVPGRS